MTGMLLSALLADARVFEQPKFGEVWRVSVGEMSAEG
jgi:hypothetical protein